jgi:hypothetical protein
MQSFPPENAPQQPLVVRAGSVLSAGAIAAVLASAPAALRMASESQGAAVAWIGLAACLTVPASLAVLLLRGARAGMRAFASDDPALTAWCLACWAIASLLVLTVLGAVLRATTHHHGLAGVTFALVGLVVLGAIAIALRRVAAIARASEPFARAAALGASLVTLVVALLLVALRVAKASDGAMLPGDSGALLVDGLAFLIAVGLCSRPELARVAWLAHAGIPLALGVVALGAALLTRDPALGAGIRTHAPLLSPLAALVDGAPMAPPARGSSAAD